MYIIYVDGSFNPITKAGGCAFVVYNGEQGPVVVQRNKRITTCSDFTFAEFAGVLEAARWVRAEEQTLQQPIDVEFRVDNLDVYHACTRYSNLGFAKSIRKVLEHMRGTVYFQWIPREQNVLADQLARLARRQVEDVADFWQPAVNTAVRTDANPTS
jgi:ribonuclease HI